jgi:hypothetical protein
MIIWIKRFARILAISSFFIVFFLGIDPSDPFDRTALFIAFLKGCLGALLFWTVGFVLADIVIKGLVAGVRTEKSDIIEGGVLQRLYEVQSGLTPEAESAAGGRERGRDSAPVEKKK